jgi:hypothetical protein
MAQKQKATNGPVQREPEAAADDKKQPAIQANRRQLSVTEKVHIFYYPWYGNPEFDSGKYYHWNHEYLPHWDKNIDARYPKGFIFYGFLCRRFVFCSLPLRSVYSNEAIDD